MSDRCEHDWPGSGCKECFPPTGPHTMPRGPAEIERRPNFTSIKQPDPLAGGGNVDYYRIFVAHPKRPGVEPHWAECEDITHALQLTPEEFCEFKAIWRTATARLGCVKVGMDAVRDAEKRVHYAGLSLTHERQKVADANADASRP